MEMPAEQFEMFQKLLVDRSGLLFSAERQDRLFEKIEERMRARGIKTLEAYYEHLSQGQKSEDEFKSLLDILTIGETYFFRNEPQFDALKKHIVPEMIGSQTQAGANSRGQLRIWCAGCSTGEEPYSIAMMLLGILPDIDAWDISILATDINRQSLAFAKKGVYSERSVHLVPDAFLERYFKKRGNRFELSDTVKKMVTFKYHNLVADAYSEPEMRDLQLLVCRNVTIYFGHETLKRIINKFSDCLIEDGYLVIGHSETLWDTCTLFEAVEFTDTFLYRKSLGKRREAQPVHIPVPLVEELVSIDPPAHEPSAPKEAPRDNRSADLDGLLNEATLRANRAEYDAALSICAEIIRQDNLSLSALYLMAVLLDRTGKYEKAIETFRRVLFLDSTLAVCYLHLGNLFKRLGRTEQAGKEFSNCLKLLSSLKEDAHVALSDGLSVGVLSHAAKSALESCRHGAAKVR